MMISCQILLDFYYCPLRPNNCMKCQAHSHISGPFTQTPPMFMTVLHCSQLRCLRTSSVLIYHLSFRNMDNINCLLACALVTSPLSVTSRIIFFTHGENLLHLFFLFKCPAQRIELKYEIITITTNDKIYMNSNCYEKTCFWTLVCFYSTLVTVTVYIITPNLPVHCTLLPLCY